jgi:predicted transcriptional regulator
MSGIEDEREGGHVNVHVGIDQAATKARFLAAIRRAEGGDLSSESHLTFESWEGLSKILTGKRLELLRHLHARPAASIAELGRALGRDYKRVHEDVEILTTSGLIVRTETGGLRVAFDEIKTAIDLRQSAA